MSQIEVNSLVDLRHASAYTNPAVVLIAVLKCGNGEDLRPDDEIAAGTVRSLRRRQCAVLCAKIRLHVTRLMESARFYCNRKLFCARRLRPSYRTSHMLTGPV